MKCDRGRGCVTGDGPVSQFHTCSHSIFTTKPYNFTRGIARLWFFLYGGVARETKAAAFRRAASKTRKVWNSVKPLTRVLIRIPQTLTKRKSMEEI